VTVGYYPVIGGSAQEIARSMETNGPHSGWIGGRATAAVEVSASFDFEFVEGGGGCRVETFDSTPVEASYHVILPSWQPPADTPSSVVDWWVANLTETVDHEGHHIELYESFMPEMNAAVMNGTCESAEADLVRLWNEASRANCIFDLEEYGYAAGLTVEACLAE
jgi:predicted secreted Zn-dependent protease